ncbi:putative DNA base hypermodification protein [Streptomyces sp. ID05-04B]|uniref:nucleotide kinase domain-containing protein n=1 Tax=Streptomyces sp. ID05-04B TaxID=3028661 RepID=UPI0029C242C1|nr:nucleotide kinase domain-containing protein [Streptomyces sp. ID05-04B]MDX5562832.1 putative DNA base hypermodification protein [Streptomyces sp. ID05-04B]
MVQSMKAGVQLGSGERVVSKSVVTIAGRDLLPTPVFDTYWRFAAARQAIYEARLQGQQGPWTTDPILSEHRFTNCFRAADRVSQYAIGQVIYTGDQDWTEVFFRTVLFKTFNRISTWELLCSRLGEVSWSEFSFAAYNKVLSEAFQAGERLYSAAYVVPPPALGEARKHSNHLRLIETMMAARVPEQLAEAASMRSAFEVLLDFPSMGNFLAYQHLIDLNYSAVLTFGEMDFVVPGPGARDGIRKCFGSASRGIEAEIIRYMADHQDEHFARLGLEFSGLRGRPLQLIDCQNLFCEVDKYARRAHPEIEGISGRTQIKQSYRSDPGKITAWFPPKWGLNAPDQQRPPTPLPSCEALSAAGTTRASVAPVGGRKGGRRSAPRVPAGAIPLF